MLKGTPKAAKRMAELRAMRKNFRNGFTKGSPEAIAYMSKLRGKRKNQLVKGSPEAKAYMAKLRSMRKKGPRKSKKVTKEMNEVANILMSLKK